MNALDTALVPDVRSLSELAPPATLAEARERRDSLARLLGREREAAADFLLALSDFDRRRGWERLGHASLFAFLIRELALSKGAAYLRFTAARLLPRHPAVERALRRGELCLSAVGELARVLTQENEAEVLPRFLGRSAREAKEVAAALAPHPAPPTRAVVTLVPGVQRPPPPSAGPAFALVPACAPDRSVEAPAGPPTSIAAELVRTSEPNLASLPIPARAVTPASRSRETPAAVEPLTADLRRLHVTVSARFLEKVAAARDGLSHAMPGASTEQVLEAALDLLLAQQARRKALVKRPRAVPTPTPTPTPTSNPATRPGVPDHVEREVRLRDGDRCQYPLDKGGVCGSTWQVQLDHVVPDALGGPTTVANLRCACAFHNRRAAEEALGPVVAGLRRRRARRS